MEQKIVLKDIYTIIKEIGSGAFGKVYEVDCKTDGKKYAVKRLKRDEISKSDYLVSALDKELKVMKECECENSVKLVESFITSSNYNIVMELCDGDLENWLNKYKGLPSEDEVREILIGLNNCFKIIDAKNVLHRDLKLKNIMVTSTKNGGKIDFIPKLSDFGFSKVVGEDITVTHTKLGTPATMAPEILQNREYTKKCDIWSLGVIIYQLLFKVLPFRAKNEKELLLTILNSKGVFKIPEGLKMSDQLHDLLRKMLTIDPNHRIAWKDYLKHPFFISKVESELDKFEKKYGSINNISDNQGLYNIAKAINKQTGELVYIKEIDKQIINSNDTNKKLFNKEIDLLKKLSGIHPSFIKFIDFYETNKHYLIVTEYFEGKTLESFITTEKNVDESIIQEIIRQMIPALEIFGREKIVLESLTTKSLYFKSFTDNLNFNIKFFDYGLSKAFSDEIFQRQFDLNETILNEKTNVLSLGLIIYKMYFGVPLINFNKFEGAKLTLSKTKSIKLSKPINKNLKSLLERTCHLTPDKRYNFNELFEDNFIKYIKSTKNSMNLNDNLKNSSINDFQIENLAESLILKCETVFSYFIKLFGYKFDEKSGKVSMSIIDSDKKNSRILKYSKYYKEMSIFTILLQLEIQLFSEFLLGNFESDGELHLVKICDSKYDYSYCNFLSNKISINKENPKIKVYLDTLKTLEGKIFSLIKGILDRLEIKVEEIETFEYLQDAMKNFYLSSTEKYFFALFEQGCDLFTQKEYDKAYEEILVSKYYYENLLFIRMISHSKSETANFFDMSYCLENEEYINLNSNLKQVKTTYFNNLVLYTFLGGIYKSFKKEKIIEEDLTTQSTIGFSKDAVDSLISFYPDMLRLLVECAKCII